MTEVIEGRTEQVGSFTVRRALPTRGRRTVGPWCFADHMGPKDVDPSNLPEVGPHPHIGLATVTWLLDGAQLHRDSLGSEQVIRPGQLNLMTAGDGVQHSEEGVDQIGRFEGIQLWLALPDATRTGPAAFEHHGDLPRVDLGAGTATLLVGELLDATSPARMDSPTLGAELDLHGSVDVPLRRDFEYALVVLRGAADLEDAHATPGHVAILDAADEVRLRAEPGTRAMLLGGAPFGQRIAMWWNFVGVDRGHLAQAGRDWAAHHERFGRLDSALPRLAAPPAPWPAGA